MEEGRLNVAGQPPLGVRVACISVFTSFARLYGICSGGKTSAFSMLLMALAYVVSLSVW